MVHWCANQHKSQISPYLGRRIIELASESLGLRLQIRGQERPPLESRDRPSSAALAVVGRKEERGPGAEEALKDGHGKEHGDEDGGGHEAK